jgi:hypothetical protein
VIIVSCSSDPSPKKSPGPDPVVSHIDASVKPGDDFFLYANGERQAKNRRLLFLGHGQPEGADPYCLYRLPLS